MEKILHSEKIVFNSLNENNKVKITSVVILAFSILLIANALAAYCIDLLLLLFFYFLIEIFMLFREVKYYFLYFFG